MPVGRFITRSGPFLAGSDTVRVKVNGVGGHGATSHLARSPVSAACAIIDVLNDFPAQEIDARHATTFTVASCRVELARELPPEHRAASPGDPGHGDHE